MAKQFVSDEIKTALKGLSKEAREEILKIAEEDRIKALFATIPQKSKELQSLWDLKMAIVGLIAKAKDSGDVPRSTTLEKIMSLPAEVGELSNLTNDEILKIHKRLFSRKKREKRTQTAEGTEVKDEPKRKRTAVKKA